MRNLAVTSVLALSLALAACKGAEAPAPSSESREESAALSAPDINPAAAPGVAFTYAYEFVLPDKAISAVQEGHAQACERLGMAQCRITGMRYTLLDEDRISAELQLKLAPQLARAFGKEGIAAVEKAAGKLVEARISGDDVSSTIASAETTGADAAKRLAEIEAKLKTLKVGDNTRAELEAQANQLRDAIGQAKNAKAGAEAQLASTPMTFSYRGDAGFAFAGNPVSEAVNGAWGSFSTMIWFVMMALGIVLPWLALLLLGVVIWRTAPVRWLRRFLRGRPNVAPPTADQSVSA